MPTETSNSQTLLPPKWTSIPPPRTSTKSLGTQTLNRNGGSSNNGTQHTTQRSGRRMMEMIADYTIDSRIDDINKRQDKEEEEEENRKEEKKKTLVKMAEGMRRRDDVRSSYKTDNRKGPKGCNNTLKKDKKKMLEGEEKKEPKGCNNKLKKDKKGILEGEEKKKRKRIWKWY